MLNIVTILVELAIIVIVWWNYRGNRGISLDPANMLNPPPITYYCPFQGGTSLVLPICCMLLCPSEFGLQQSGHLNYGCL